MKVFLDVRLQEEFSKDGLDGSINIPHYTIMNNLHKLPEDREILVYCNSGTRADLVTRVLDRLGFNVTNIKTINHAMNMQQEML